MQRSHRRDEPGGKGEANTRRSSRRKTGSDKPEECEATAQPTTSQPVNLQPPKRHNETATIHGQSNTELLLKVDVDMSLSLESDCGEGDLCAQGGDATKKGGAKSKPNASMPEKRKLDLRGSVNCGRKKPCLKDSLSGETAVAGPGRSTQAPEMDTEEKPSPAVQPEASSKTDVKTGGSDSTGEDFSKTKDNKTLSPVNLVQPASAGSATSSSSNSSGTFASGSSAPSSVDSSSTSVCSSPGNVHNNRGTTLTSSASSEDGDRSIAARSSVANPFSPSFPTYSHSQGTQTNEFHRKIPSRAHPPPGLKEWLEVFKGWSHAERLVSLDQLVELCEPQQVKHVMAVIEPQFQRDFISLLPKELALYVLSYLEPKDLARAAQTCRYWRILCEDNLLWKEKCMEADIDEPLLIIGGYDDHHRTRTVSEASSSVDGSLCHSYRGGTIECAPPMDAHSDPRLSPSPPVAPDSPLAVSHQRHPSASHVESHSTPLPYIPPQSPLVPSEWKRAYMRQHDIEMNWRRRPLRHPKILKGHDDHVITCLQFWGNRIVSGSDDNTLKVWSADSGKCLRTLVGHTGGVWSSQMKDHIIISGSTDRTLKVWNAETGLCIHTLYGHTSTVRCMHIHGSTVVSGSRDATLRIWDIDTGECLHVLMGHVAAVRCVQYDGKRVISGAYDYMVKVWNPDTEECLYTLQGHTNRVYSLQFDGKHIVSGSLDTSIRVWDVDTGNCIHTLIGHQSLTSGMQLKNNILVSGNADSTVKVWDIISGQCLQTLSGSNKHQSAVTCLEFNTKFVVTSSDDGTVKLWDLRTGEFVRNLVTLDSGGSGGVVWRVRASPTKLVCAVGSRNGTEETKLLVLDFDVNPPSMGTNTPDSSAASVGGLTMEEGGDASDEGDVALLPLGAPGIGVLGGPLGMQELGPVGEAGDEAGLLGQNV